MINKFLHIDSRNRISGSTPSHAEFNLPEPIRGISRFRLKYLQFVNTFFNVTAESNTLALLSGSVVTVDPGFYRATELVQALGVPVLGQDGQLSWDLGTDVVDFANTTIHRQLGLDPAKVYTGSFVTTLQLAMPQSICLVSPHLIGPERQRVVYAGKAQSTLQSFVNIPVTAPYLSVETYRPETESSLILDSNGNGHFSRLQIGWFDPSSERELTELGEWTLLLELF